MFLKNSLTIIVLISSFAFTSCKDTVTQTNPVETTVITSPSTGDDAGSGDHISSIIFKGIDQIVDVKQKEIKVLWTPVQGAGSYQVFFITETGIELQQTYNHPKNNAVIRNLEPDTEYQILVRMMDIEGKIDINDNRLSARTNLLPDYNNNKSVLFSGSQGISLAPSNQMITNGFVTLSLWFKTSTKQEGSEARLISLHSDVTASTVLAIGLEDTNLFALYKNSNNEILRMNFEFSYDDGVWHHIALTYNHTWYTMYIDGTRVKSAKDSNLGYGEHPVSIGSYSGMQKSFTGLIDEVSIWSSALGKKDIQSIYNNGSPIDLKQHIRVPALQAWYRLGDDENDSVFSIQDQMNQFHGTPIGIRDSDFVIDTPFR